MAKVNSHTLNQDFMKDIRNYTYEELLIMFKEKGHKEFRVRQLFKWLYDKLRRDFDEMTDLSKDFRSYLKENYLINSLEVFEIQKSTDGTQKFLFKTLDNKFIESVFMPIDNRFTICISSQVGCPMDCKFCCTGSLGFDRNLEPWEIIEQLSKVIENTSIKPNNVVFMGMGEPLLNYDSVLKAIKILRNPYGYAYSAKKITLSTSGIVDAIKRLGYDTDIKLAVSLNATTDEQRDKIMPINKKYPLNTLISALKDYPLEKDGEITIEYVMIKDFNDSIYDARRLVSLLKDIRAKINLIVFNEWSGTDFASPPFEKVLEFQKILREMGFLVFIRDSKGADISAACGQLKGKRITNAPYN